ncbi:MAG: hypothetical protein H7Y00_16475 [Fimbriimonadaceae bacterium]|nr:hypothetical protein [Chitinophagales bacterium]
MLRIFQNISPASFLLLLFYFAGLSVHVFLYPTESDFSNLTILSNLIVNEWTGFSNLNETTLLIIALICIFLQGILMCIFMNYFKMLNKFSLIPAVIYYLMCFLFPEFISFFPLLVINFLLVGLLFLLFSVYNKTKIDAGIFNIGLLITIIIMLYSPAAIFIIFCLYTLLRLRSTAFREILVFFSAVILLYFLQATLLFWFDMLPAFTRQFSFKFSPEIRNLLDDPVLIVKLILSIILLIISFFFLQQKTSGMLIQTRKYFSCLATFSIFAIASALFASTVSVKNIYPALFPASIINAYYFIHLKNREAAEIIHLAVLGIVLLFQYINFAA